MSKTKIEWTQHTWNPIVGCSIVSPGCTNCYAMSLAYRVECINAEAAAKYKPEPSPQYNGTTKRVNGNAVWTGRVARSEKALDIPLRRKVPTTWFVNSMSDLFHENVPDEEIDRVFAVMALTPQHTYQILTKRSARMREYFRGRQADFGRCSDALLHITHGFSESHHERAVDELDLADLPDGRPQANVWLGVSTERQKEADERIPDLLATPAAVRFISAEPLLGPIDLNDIPWPKDHPAFPETDDISDSRAALRLVEGRKLDWVIVGGESGSGARPMHPDWARSLRDQCKEAGVPFFFKQWGSWRPIVDRDNEDPDWRADYSRANYSPDKYRILNLEGGCGFHGERVHLMQRYSKSACGRILDGAEHNGMPGGEHADQ